MTGPAPRAYARPEEWALQTVHRLYIKPPCRCKAESRGSASQTLNERPGVGSTNMHSLQLQHTPPSTSVLSVHVRYMCGPDTEESTSWRLFGTNRGRVHLFVRGWKNFGARFYRDGGPVLPAGDSDRLVPGAAMLFAGKVLPPEAHHHAGEHRFLDGAAQGVDCDPGMAA